MHILRAAKGVEIMTDCTNRTCENCTCGRADSAPVDNVHANSNFLPAPRPDKVVRRDPVDAAKQLAVRFEETLKILA